MCVLLKSKLVFLIGEFMQLGTRGEEEQRFNHYMKKNYRKTGSLIANSCKAVSGRL